MNTSEARRAVSAIYQAERTQDAAYPVAQSSLHQLGKIASATECETGATQADTDTLKVAAFGLFVEPVSRGIEQFIDDSQSLFEPGERCGAREVGLRIGSHIYEVALGALQKDSDLEQLTQQLAEARAQLANSPNHAQMLAPLTTSLRSAAGSSVQSMINVALANAYALQQAHGGSLPQAELIPAVRASTHLALAIPMVHLLDLPIVNTILSAHNYGGMMGRGYPDPILQVNKETNIVTMGKPLQQWNLGPALTIAETAGKNGDVRIGCPFSFAPKDLRVAYYQTVVDIMHTHMADAWPATTI